MAPKSAMAKASGATAWIFAQEKRGNSGEGKLWGIGPNLLVIVSMGRVKIAESAVVITKAMRLPGIFLESLRKKTIMPRATSDKRQQERLIEPMCW